MRELQREEIGDRRVRLLVNQEHYYTVTIEVRGPQGTWEDISLVADQNLPLHPAHAADQNLSRDRGTAS
jgi:hypothetical protein